MARSLSDVAQGTVRQHLDVFFAEHRGDPNNPNVFTISELYDLAQIAKISTRRAMSNVLADMRNEGLVGVAREGKSYYYYAKAEDATADSSTQTA